MKLSVAFVKDFLKKHFEIEGEVRPLPGELDLNFFVRSSVGQPYILKIANLHEQRKNLELQNALIKHLTKNKFGLEISRVVASTDGSEILEITDAESGVRLVRLLTWIEGEVFASANPHSPELLEKLGGMCGKLCRSLADFEHQDAHRFMKWDPSQLEWTKKHHHLFSGEHLELVTHFYSLFEKETMPIWGTLRKSVNYNDANDYNVLVSGPADNPAVPGVIDFGDVVYTHTINELAIAIAYAVMHKAEPLDAACHIVRGFNREFEIQDEELKVLFSLVTARLLISVACSAINREEHPENKYLQISDSPAWELLKKLRGIAPSLVYYSFRDACGLEACPLSSVFHQWAETNFKKVVYPILMPKEYAWLDLSVGSLDLGDTSVLMDAVKLNAKVSALMDEARVSVALGKYNEARGLYTTDAFASQGNDAPQWRTVHTGLDFFVEPGVPVMAVLDGTVHSFANNSSERDYGPTIILSHRISSTLVFYTLYGHLSLSSLKDMKAGQSISKGEKIGSIGVQNENGNWPPHLHFQIILDMLGRKGEFQGVAFAHQRALWTSISPDPWKLFTGNNSEQSPARTNSEIIKYRQAHLGKNMSISYRDPIKMVRGNDVYLLDNTGRRYLDTVNNVAHVGHEHPRIVAAGQRQMAVLNTNTRYLHDNIVLFVESLLVTMPSALNVAFIVNSGSEANELALRLAKNYTAQQDMIVSEMGYHGNTNGCVEISSYKFDGPGGKGVPTHVHVIPLPDTYRGKYRADDQKAGSKYAQHVMEAVNSIKMHGRAPAALIFESVISCGGQVELPKNFLKEAYQFVRGAGGVCIADEVQTGCGRSGEHFWAFEEHGVVPDIVTIGKPIGNGHPLGVVVTTQKIADAFKNGMEYFNTFGGNPVSCAVGLEVLRVITDEGLQRNAKIVGDYLKSRLKGLMKDYAVIGDIRGPGLFMGVEFVRNRISKEPATEQASYFVNRMREKGILMSLDGPYNNVLKVKPPITFSTDHADFLTDTMVQVLKENFMKIGE